MQWLRKTELDLHFGEDVVRPDEPVLYGVKQDDEAIDIPPWATKKRLEEYLARPEELEQVEQARLERKARIRDATSTHNLEETSDFESEDSEES